MAGKKVVGGAIKTKHKVKKVETVEAGKDMIKVVTTSQGTLSGLGIVPIGTKAEIPLQAFSSRWMYPRDTRSANLVAKAERVATMKKNADLKS